MAMTDKYRLEIGDWVKGKSKDGELIYGYIQTVDSLQGIVRVNVVECDNEQIIGKTIGMPNKRVEKLSISTTSTKEQIVHLIDLALLTRDEQWFMDLSAKLNAVRQRSKKEAIGSIVYPTARNRIEKSDTRG
ncbi:IDEAL domain-containing protein [Ectobacillus panaciterrae]|uniref:IDEAL domain-containing protein n=1 Tax=Ectobacillus panaciterrae TaxID=363872 RepID=UPI0003FDB6DF|nr:IDEAL domain-containing protein [Ectobacillus panaciterrae]